MKKIEQALYDYIVKEAGDKAPATLDADYDLIDSGIMDSLFMMMLITWVEKNYQIEFGLNDIVPENFRTINALSALVNRQPASTA